MLHDICNPVKAARLRSQSGIKPPKCTRAETCVVDGVAGQIRHKTLNSEIGSNIRNVIAHFNRHPHLSKPIGPQRGSEAGSANDSRGRGCDNLARSAAACKSFEHRTDEGSIDAVHSRHSRGERP
mmetsp:Transcript_83784/g.241948  ORF Transcript_83784/g.241948 Transcript_83784/m.241948 type:complete len:125 (-) Transcript_83784:50-424(-)